MQLKTPSDGPWQLWRVGQSDAAQVQVTVPAQPAGMVMQA